MGSPNAPDRTEGARSGWKALLNGGRPEFPEEFWTFIRAVEEYRTRRAGRKESIIVLFSMASYLAACGLMYGLGTARGWAAGLLLLFFVILTLILWAVAGMYAEEDPPLEGREAFLGQLLSYEPVAEAAYAALLERVKEGKWSVSDVVAFIRVESRANLALQRARMDEAASKRGLELLHSAGSGRSTAP